MSRGFKIIAVAVGALVVLWLVCLPRQPFADTPYSTVVSAQGGELLGARIADDGQWRFPPGDSIPEKFAVALVEFEDRRFEHHPGVSPHAIARAAWQNLRHGRTVSGASTITMQLVRMMRHKPRTMWQKVVEMFMATRMEARFSKHEILCLYASHAPFGGNVVGIDAALWRYCGGAGADLSWAEAATLAVLQNSPALIHPGKNRNALLEKRNRLLRHLAAKGHFDELALSLALEEPLLDKPLPLPSHAPHFVAWQNSTKHGRRVMSSIDFTLQERLAEITDRWLSDMRTGGINDLAAVVIDVQTGFIKAYIGNADPAHTRPGVEVDIVRSPRSSGSILKPLLYCAALQEGVTMPDALLPDVPTNYSGFAPQNFDTQFAGAVPASEALSHSLNVPFVHLQQVFGVMRFVELLRGCGISTLTRSADDYGLSLILGGGEVTLLEITSAYARMAAEYQAAADFPLHDRVALWHTFEALRRVDRPDQMDWHRVGAVQQIAWKTGTSYGSRDAWAVGITPRWAVGVWAGNAQGQNSPDLTGARAAGPVMFDIFNALERCEWFAEPLATDGVMVRVCRHSGFVAGLDCHDGTMELMPAQASRAGVCPWHTRSGFALPPTMEFYYRQRHPEYVAAAGLEGAMRFVYPASGSVLSTPRQADGTVRGTTFTLAHKNNAAEVFWHLDGSYIGSTRDIHKLVLAPAIGAHILTVVDESGESTSIEFRII